MKPNEQKPATVFRIIDRATGQPRGVYSRACCDEVDFPSPEDARHANCHGIYDDKIEELVPGGTLHSWKGKDADGRTFTASVMMANSEMGRCHLQGRYDDGAGKKVDAKIPRVFLQSMWMLHNMKHA